ncbi:MAG: hypothetical protein ACTH02_09500 [Corynebacterium sp.]
MSFRHLPPVHAIAQRVTFAAAYTAVLAAGVASLAFTPVTIAGTLGAQITWLWASLAVVGGLVGLTAVAINKWRVEMWAAPLALGGALGYATGVWSLVSSETITRLTQASWIAALVLLLAARTIHIWAIASSDRRRHDRRERLNRLLDELED